MFGIDWSLWMVLGLWSLVMILCVYAAGVKLNKYLAKKKQLKNKPKLTIIQGGKKDESYGKSR